MASCPPPPKKLEPPDVAPIEFLKGRYKLSAAVFYKLPEKKWISGFYDQRSTAAPGPGTGGTQRDHRGTSTGSGPEQVGTWTKLSSKMFRDPVVWAVISTVEKNAKGQWNMVAGDVKMTDMIDVNRPAGWTIRYGSLQALVPEPGETVRQYRNRGGVPIPSHYFKNWRDGHGDEHLAIPLGSVLPSWVDKHNSDIEKFHLHIQWDGRIGRSMVLHTRIETPGRMDKVGDAIARAIRWACSKLTNDKLMGAAAMATMAPSPEVQAAVAAYMAAAALCNKAWPSCAPPAQPNVPGLITPIQISAVPSFPPGTIAWFDKKLGAYRIASPRTLGGLEATHVETQAAASVPPSVTVVSRFTWENATRPLWQRTWFLVTSGVAAVGGIAGATVAIRRRRTHA